MVTGESRCNKNRTIVYNPKLFETPSQGVLKISRKMYVIEFSFNKIVRLHCTAYYRIKNSTTGSTQKGEDVLKF